MYSERQKQIHKWRQGQQCIKEKKINIITNTDKESGSVFSSSEMGIS